MTEVFNPFQIADPAIDVPVAELEIIQESVAELVPILINETETEIEVTTDGKPPKGFNKDGSKRKDRAKNPPISKEMKAQIIKRYSVESPNAIATSLGLDPRQVYNVVRNSKLLLEKAIKAETDVDKLALMQQKLTLFPHKEATGAGGSSGPRANTLSIEDILNLV